MSNSDFFEDKEKDSDPKAPVRPEFILIDEREGKTRQTFYGSDSTKKPYEEIIGNSSRRPKSLRLVCLFGFLFCLVFSLIVICIAVVVSLTALLALFRDSTLNKKMWTFWAMLFDTVIAGLRFIVGIISPALGLGLISLYFSLLHSAKNHSFFQILRKSFSKF